MRRRRSASSGEAVGPVRKRSPAPPLPASEARPRLHLGEEGRPGDRGAAAAQLLGAIVVVEPQDQRLLDGGGRAQRLGMRRVPLDLGRVPLVALDQEAAREALERVAGREVERVPGSQLLGAPHEGDDLLVRLAAGRADGGDRRRHAEELHEPTARDRPPARRRRREIRWPRPASPRASAPRWTARACARPERRRASDRWRATGAGTDDGQRTPHAIVGAGFVVVVAAH